MNAAGFGRGGHPCGRSVCRTESAEGLFGPALGEVVVRGVIDFPDGEGGVALGFEMLGHGKCVGVFLTHGRFVIPAPCGLGAEPGHEAGAGGSADCDLAIGSLEESSLCGERVDVG